MRGLDQSFREISSAPLSLEELRSWQKAVASIRNSYPCLDHPAEMQAAYDKFLKQDHQMSSYTTIVKDLDRIEDGTITQSRRDLARNGYIAETDINTYLELLQSSNTDGVRVEPITPLAELDSVISSISYEKTSIIPVRTERGWAFTAKYPNRVHWHDSNQSSSETDPSSLQTPPIPDTKCTGLAMLLGIRLVIKKLPHVSGEALDNGLPHFRDRLLVELACGQLDPDESVVSAARRYAMDLVDNEQAVDSEYFNDALGERFEPGVGVYHYSSNTEAFTGASSGGDGDAMPPSADTPGGSLGATSAPNTLLSQSSTRRRRRLPRTQDPPARNDTKDILEILSSAVAMARFAGASHKTEMLALCNVMEVAPHSSDFHSRYWRASLYHKIMLKTSSGYEISQSHVQEYKNCTEAIRGSQVQESEVEAIKEESRLWMMLCDLCASRRIHSYTLLCAIPKNRVFSIPTLTGLSNRLNDANDPLPDLLRDAEALCLAIVSGNLPVYMLCIETYHMKRWETFCENSFRAYTSLEQGPKVRTTTTPPSLVFPTSKRRKPNHE
ncbi:hypothetical protein FALBO_12938 [Fusarium albosuccineum]|uniref:Uncharacterized protein n=1 Tax=Fusarium albosuccineum TaxID=1237068 RepID=A0A8H4L273_9HYPO|nr:hypothetical protein FALBO_12938 [Fusarium albosuccineum]